MVNNQWGMTLIEVLVALLILLLCAAPISTGILVCKKQVESAEKKLAALQLAQGKLEELMSYDFRDIEDIQPGAAFPEPYADYGYGVEVTGDADYPASLKIITVTVSYHESESAGINSVSITGAKAWR